MAAAQLSLDDIRALFDAMGEEVANHGSEFTFVQLRLSAERFVVPLCGLSAEQVLRRLKPEQYRVFLEKKLRRFRPGPVDLVLAPRTDGGNHDLETAYCFEFKMVWLKGIKQNLSGIRNDIEKLNGYERGFLVAVLFTFDRKLDWAPYSHEGSMEHLLEKVVTDIGKPVYEGRDYTISSHEVTGKLKLVAWPASPTS